MLVEREPDLPLPHRLPQPPHDGAQGHRGNPCGFLQPHRAARRGMLAPAPPRCHGAMVCLSSLEHRGIHTDFWPPRGGQDAPPRRRRGGGEGLWGHDEALADRALRGGGLRRTAST